MADAELDHVARTQMATDRARFVKGAAVLRRVNADGSDKEKMDLGQVFRQAPESCDNCGKVGHRRKQCTEPPPEPTCRKCGEVGHVKKDCPTEDRCHRCNEPGHKRKDCPHRACTECGEQGHQSQACPARVCRRCHRNGHSQRNCPAAKDDPSCGNCGAQGHMTLECEEPCSTCGDSYHKNADCTNSTATPADAKEKKSAHIEAEKEKETAAEKEEETAAEKEEETAAEKEEEKGDKGKDMKKDEPLFPDEETLECVLRLDVQPGLISRWRFEMISHQFSAPDSVKMKRIVSILRGVAANTDGDILVEILDVHDPKLAALTTPKILSDLQVHCQKGGDVTHFRIKFKRDEQNSPRGLVLSQAFWGCSAAHGRFQAELDRAQQMLTCSDPVYLDYFAPNKGWAGEVVRDLNERLQEDQRVSPMLQWWPNSRVVAQRGMQLPVADRPPVVNTPQTIAYDDMDQYLTEQYYSIIPLLEEIEDNRWIETKVCLVTFEGGGDRLYYAIIRLAPDFTPREDSHLLVAFEHAGADISRVWKAQVVAMTPLTGAHSVCAFLFRQYTPDGRGFDDSPHFTEDMVIDSDDYEGDLESIRLAVHEHACIKCFVRETEPKDGLAQQIKTLHRLQLLYPRNDFLKDLLLGNDPSALRRVNYFQPDIDRYGQAQVDTALADPAFTDLLSDEQRKILVELQDMAGGVQCLQGPGGVGKSRLLVALLAYHVLVGQGDAAQIVCLSPINQQLNQLARSAYNTLVDLATEQRKKDLNAPAPVVIRLHASPVEHKVVRKAAEDLRAQLLKDKRPLYLEPLAVADSSGEHQDDDEDVEGNALLEQVAANTIIRKQYEALVRQGFDKRLVEIDLSLGSWMRRRMGLLVEGDDGPHRIAAPEKYRDVISALEDLARGEKMSTEDKDALTKGLNRVRNDVFKLAHAIFCTPHTYAQDSTHRNITARAVYCDENGKMLEVDTLTAILYSREYTVEGGYKFTNPDKVIPLILCGDALQPRPVGAHRSYPFSNVRSMSLFHRFSLLGMNTHEWWKQHRFVEGITNLVNHLLPSPRLITAPELRTRSAAVTAQRLVEQCFNIKVPTVWMEVDEGKQHKNPATKSSFNLENVPVAMASLTNLLLRGVKGKDIGIGTFYQASRASYVSALHSLFEHCAGKDSTAAYRGIASEVQDVQCFTIDGIQGGEKNILIMDTVVTDEVGFLYDPARILLGITRARYALIIIGNMTRLQGAHQDGGLVWKLQQWAMYKLYQYMLDKKAVVVLRDLPEEHRNTLTIAPNSKHLRLVLEQSQQPPQPKANPFSFHQPPETGFSAHPAMEEAVRTAREQDEASGGDLSGGFNGGEAAGWGGGDAAGDSTGNAWDGGVASGSGGDVDGGSGGDLTQEGAGQGVPDNEVVLGVPNDELDGSESSNSKEESIDNNFHDTGGYNVDW